MAKITLVINDTEEGVEAKFLSDTPLPANINEFTPAQKFANELKDMLELLNV